MDLTDGIFLRREFARLNERFDRLEASLARIEIALGADGSSGTAPEVDSIVRDLLRSGNKLQAIKAYQHSTGVNLAAAEAFIDRWGDRLAGDATESNP